MSKRDFLVEIGTEELPPKSLFTLAQAFASGIGSGLDAANLNHGAVEWFATPRRLAVRVVGIDEQQPDQEIRRQGPAITNAFDSAGQPTKAALGFAASCGVSLEELQQVDGPKGKLLQFVGTKQGAQTLNLLPSIVTTALDALPIAKRKAQRPSKASSSGKSRVSAERSARMRKNAAPSMKISPQSWRPCRSECSMAT